MESTIKGIIKNKEKITVIKPEKYAKRFSTKIRDILRDATFIN